MGRLVYNIPASVLTSQVSFWLWEVFWLGKMGIPFVLEWWFGRLAFYIWASVWAYWDLFWDCAPYISLETRFPRWKLNLHTTRTIYFLFVLAYVCIFPPAVQSRRPDFVSLHTRFTTYVACFFMLCLLCLALPLEESRMELVSILPSKSSRLFVLKFTLSLSA